MMKKTFIIIGVLVCIVAFPFRSMLIEALTVTTAPRGYRAADPVHHPHEGHGHFA